ncbi:TerB family tellurite resistance protein [Flavobacterium plurextorum]|uniref:TerB family tellurite resistance protein n=1 Tax=Flavobacterium TaxID=237 RepID=UPI00214D2EB8|nr:MULTISPECIES: TerB family tellurite resistance protein [Flavobacterium]UUW11265.1 TerB family tellurite resistance protein [Flavobacterium plurextorum]
MKKKLLIFAVSLLMCVPFSAKAQSAEIQQLILNIEKLSQFKKILSDMKKGYDILSGGYKAVKDMSEGNFSLHKTFLDALRQVSPVVKNYKRVADIVDYQFTLMKESHKGLEQILKNERFSEKEIQYFEKVYSNLSRESLRNIDELTSVITSDKLRMTDDERLEAIDRIYEDMQQKVLFLRDFNGSASVLALQRSKESNDAASIRKNYHFKD